MDSKNTDDVYQYLNDNELQVLDDINDIQEKIHNHKNEKKRLENMTIKDLFGLWLGNNVAIINDVSKINYSSFEKYFNDIDNTKFWWRGLVLFISYIYNILTKGNRIIFTGINMIIISILIYFISSSS